MWPSQELVPLKSSFQESQRRHHGPRPVLSFVTKSLVFVHIFFSFYRKVRAEKTACGTGRGGPTPLISTFGGRSQKVFEFETKRVYRVSFRTVRTTQETAQRYRVLDWTFSTMKSKSQKQTHTHRREFKPGTKRLHWVQTLASISGGFVQKYNLFPVGDSENFEGLTYGGGEDGPNSVHREKSSTNQNSVLNYKDSWGLAGTFSSAHGKPNSMKCTMRMQWEKIGGLTTSGR